MKVKKVLFVIFSELMFALMLVVLELNKNTVWGFVLASPISVAILLCYIPIIAKRMKNEEKILEEGLEGYIDYKKRVKYKVIPFVW